MTSKLRSVFSSPYGVMSCVLAMYVFKVVAKIALGSYINSPMISGDGYHNIADILEAVFVITVIVLANRPADEKYPFGRKNAESIFELAVGAGLILMALRVMLSSLSGLLEYAPGLKAVLNNVLPLPVHEPLKMGPEYFWLVLGTMVISVALSLAMSRYEISVGKRTGHKSLVADGEETRSDSMVELAVIAGVLGEYLFRAPWLEYPFGLFVSFLLARTGREIVARGWRALLQRSIGTEREQAIREIAAGTYGVVQVADLKTFMIGPMAVVIMKVVTRCTAQADLDIKSAIAARLEQYLEEQEFEQWDYYIRFDRPTPNRRRIAYAIHTDKNSSVVASGLRQATHLRICDVEDDVIVRWKDVPTPVILSDALLLLKSKQVRQLRAFSEEQYLIEQVKAAGIEYADASTLLVNPPSIAHICSTEPAAYRSPESAS